MSDANADADAEASTAGSLRRLWAQDATKIVALLAVIYGAYLVSGLVLGYSIRGQLNSLASLTFYIGVFATLALALNLQWGYTGLFNIGVVGFMAVGIYVMAFVSKPLYGTTGAAQVGGLGLPIPVGILVGMLAAAALGFVVALPALRLRADYLAIVTIAMSEIVRFSFLSSTFQQFQFPYTLAGDTTRVGFGGGSGLILDFPDPLLAFIDVVGLSGAYDGLVAIVGGVVPNNPDPIVHSLVYGLVLLGVVAGYFWLLKRTGESPFGRVLKAIREDEDVARALGKNTDRFKIVSFMLGCALMGLAGILWLMGQGAVTPNFFRPRLTFFVWIALIIGGAGSNTGSVMGGAVFAAALYQGPLYFQNVVTAVFQPGEAPSSFGPAVSPLISSFDPLPFLLYTLDSVRQLQLVFMGVALIWLMHNRPQGMLGHRKETAAAIPLGRPGGGAGRGGGSDADADAEPTPKADGDGSGGETHE